MKYLCDTCSRLVDVDRFTVRDGALLLACPPCGAASRTAERPGFGPSAPVLEFARPRPPPGPLCPKCGAPRPDEHKACARCGLVFALFDPSAFALPQAVEQLWSQVELNWNEVGQHVAFLAACTGVDLLAEAARRYRLQAEQRPGDALAVRFRDEVVARLMALGTLPPPRPARLKLSRTVSAIVVLVFVGVFAALAWLVLRPALFP